MTRDQILFRAGLSRFAFGVLALVAMPLQYPRLLRFWWFFAVYMAIAAIEQLLIRRKIGGVKRSLIAGLVDGAAITFIVQRVGSFSTPLTALYFVAGVLNALAVGRRVGVALAVVNAATYGAVLAAEVLGAIPYAPDGPVYLVRPSAGEATAAFALVSTILIVTTLVVGYLVGALQRREAALEELSLRDPLTNLYNRRHLFERLEQELARVKRGKALAILMIDLDGFKRINDSEGHLRGDVLLKEVAAALSATTRVIDVVGRYGGDEFLVLLPDTDEAQARAVAERVQAGVREVGARFDAERPVTASIGVAVAARDDVVASIVRRADEAAYAAKKLTRSATS